jgi:hypothetical protein
MGGGVSTSKHPEINASLSGVSIMDTGDDFLDLGDPEALALLSPDELDVKLDIGPKAKKEQIKTITKVRRGGAWLLFTGWGVSSITFAHPYLFFLSL